ncbi:MAG: ComF family protein [Polaromonas sp.]|nr:ComF family protein [Polaromonas sp.]
MLFRHRPRPFGDVAHLGLPARCEVCGQWPSSPVGQPVCADCAAQLIPATRRCHTCALALPPTAARPVAASESESVSRREVCGACAVSPPPISRCVAALDYAYPWDKLIHRFKFQGDLAWADWFAQALIQAPGAADCLAQADWCLPIPLGLRRLGDRGYNQAWWLTRALTRGQRHKAHSDWLVKLVDTPAQHELDRAERQQNLRAAFAVTAQAQPPLANSSVLLVDDVITTGATLHAAALALKRAGVRRVEAMVLARTPVLGD